MWKIVHIVVDLAQNSGFSSQKGGHLYQILGDSGIFAYLCGTIKRCSFMFFGL